MGLRRASVLALIGSGVALGVVLGCGDDDEPVEPVAVEPETEAPPPEEESPAEDPAPPAEVAEEASPDETPPAADPEPPSSVAEAELSDSETELRPLPEKMANRIRSTLRESQHARVVFRESIHLHHSDGRATVFALYELSPVERCTHQRMQRESETRREAYRACREDAVASRAQGADDTECVELRLVRAALASPPQGRPEDWGGEITFGADEALSGGCVLDRVEKFRLADIDRDDRPELELAYWTATPDATFRGHVPFDRRELRWSVHRQDTLAVQAESTLATIGGDFEQMEETFDGRRVALDDRNGDEHPDLVFEVIEYGVTDPGECGFDAATGWPTEANRDEDELTGCNEYGRRSEVWPYDTDSDRWSAPES